MKFFFCGLICAIWLNNPVAVAQTALYDCDPLSYQKQVLIGVSHQIVVEDGHVFLNTTVVSPQLYKIQTPLALIEAIEDFNSYSSAHFLVNFSYGETERVELVSRDNPKYSSYCHLN